jgi:hypothetical protein
MMRAPGEKTPWAENSLNPRPLGCKWPRRRWIARREWQQRDSQNPFSFR